MQQVGAPPHCIAQDSDCNGFFYCGAQAPGHRASVVGAHGLHSWGSQALEHRLSGCGQWAELPRSMWDPPGSGIELQSPPLVGRFLTTEPAGKLSFKDGSRRMNRQGRQRSRQRWRRKARRLNYHRAQRRVLQREESSVLLGAAEKSPGTFQVALVVKNPPANAGDVRDTSSTPGSGRSPGEGNGNPFQYSCLENPTNRGSSWATVHSVAESDMTEAT